MDAGAAAAAAAAEGAAASLRRLMCDDACMQGQQNQLNSLLKPRWSGGRQEDSVPQALDRLQSSGLGGRQVCFAGAQ